MQCNIDKEILVKLERLMANLLVRVDLAKYGPYLAKEKGQSILYMKLLKALCGTLQAALLFWEDLSSYLIDEHGYKGKPI
jgi:hypothetical protein